MPTTEWDPSDRMRQGWSQQSDWGIVSQNGQGGMPAELKTDYDLRYGSDLIIDLSYPALRRISEYADGLEQKSRVGALSKEDVDLEMLEMARTAELELQARLDEMSEQFVTMSHGVQDWAVEELRRRDDARGYGFEQGSNDSHLETIAVLDDIMIELSREEEDVTDESDLVEYDKLRDMIQVWRQETFAELTHQRIRQYYELAA